MILEGVQQFQPGVTRGCVGGICVWVEREEEKPPQVETQGHKLPSDHTTRPKGHILVKGRIPG